MCSRWDILEDPDDLLLQAYQWLDVGFGWVGRAPYRDVHDEVWVDMCEVFVSHVFCWEEFRGASEVEDCGLELSDDV